MDAYFKKKDMLKAHLLHANAPEIKRPIEKYRAIIGHNTYDDIVAMQPKNPFFMTVLREPVARVVSLYYFWRSHRWDHIEDLDLKGPRLAKSLSLAEFLESENSEAVLSVQNGQARQFVNGLRGPTGMSDEELLRVTKERLQQCVFVGLTEQFERSVKLLCYLFGWEVPPKAPRSNVSLENELDDPRYEPVERKPLDDGTRKRILELNHVDVQFYEYGQEMFERSYQTMQKEYERGKSSKGKKPLLSYRIQKRFRKFCGG